MKQSLNLLHNLSTYQSLCNLWFVAGNGKEDMQLSTDTNSACVTLTDQENDWLTDWPRDWLTDWPSDWLTDQETDWLTYQTDWLTDQETDWLTKRLTDWLTDWPTNLGGLTDRSTNWKTDKLVDSYWHIFNKREIECLEAKKTYIIFGKSESRSEIFIRPCWAVSFSIKASGCSFHCCQKTIEGTSVVRNLTSIRNSYEIFCLCPVYLFLTLGEWIMQWKLYM